MKILHLKLFSVAGSRNMLFVLLSTTKSVYFTSTFGILLANDLPMVQKLMLNAFDICLRVVLSNRTD